MGHECRTSLIIVLVPVALFPSVSLSLAFPFQLHKFITDYNYIYRPHVLTNRSSLQEKSCHSSYYSCASLPPYCSHSCNISEGTKPDSK